MLLLELLAMKKQKVASQFYVWRASGSYCKKSILGGVFKYTITSLCHFMTYLAKNETSYQKKN